MVRNAYMCIIVSTVNKRKKPSVKFLKIQFFYGFEKPIQFIDSKNVMWYNHQ